MFLFSALRTKRIKWEIMFSNKGLSMFVPLGFQKLSQFILRNQTIFEI